MDTINWDKFKMRCSALAALFTEPQSKAAKEAGELSQTAKTFLYKVYIQAKWNRSKEIVTKQMTKGILVEDNLITILGFMDDKPYVKNQERKENDWISGHADIDYEPDDLIIDVKGSWEPESFIPNLIEPINKTYYYQLQGYLWLWNRKNGRLSYILDDCPEMVLQNERRRLLYSMNVATDENPEYKLAVAELERNLTFQDIPISERIINIEVPRSEEIIAQIPDKVAKARKYLAFLEKTHLKLAI